MLAPTLVPRPDSLIFAPSKRSSYVSCEINLHVRSYAYSQDSRWTTFEGATKETLVEGVKSGHSRFSSQIIMSLSFGRPKPTLSKHKKIILQRLIDKCISSRRWSRATMPITPDRPSLHALYTELHAQCDHAVGNRRRRYIALADSRRAVAKFSKRRVLEKVSDESTLILEIS